MLNGFAMTSEDLVWYSIFGLGLLFILLPWLLKLRLLWHRGSFYKGRKKGRL